MSPGDAEPSDRRLLERYCRHGDVGAFGSLLDRHQGDLLRFAHSLLGDAHAAQDAVQEAFCRLCREAHRLGQGGAGQDSLGGWLCTVVRNACIDVLRRRSHAPMTTIAEHQEGQGASPGAAVAASDAGESLWRAVATLPPLERAAVVLRYRDGLSYQDIATRLGKTATHIGVLLHQGLGRLRQSERLRAGVMP
ncbi:MAG: sigma-70 family RNA polymerase sigma factor [Planctomycetes bacterium]|nr:sigma-70 family RNA polymerase sigma factor [Planctomycetota bacterium]